MDRSRFIIRDARVDDVAQCERWLRLEQSACDRLRRAVVSSAMLVAVGNAEVFGAIAWHRQFFECAFISLLIVAESARRQGVGSELIEAVERRVGLGKLFTSTNESNAAARTLFAHAGFTISGRIDNLDPGDPELVYFKRVSLPPLVRERDSA